MNIHARKMCEYIGKGHKDNPCVGTVKQEGDKGLAPGPYGEVSAVRNRINRHIQSACLHEAGGQLTHIMGSIVYIGKNR